MAIQIKYEHALRCTVHLFKNMKQLTTGRVELVKILLHAVLPI
jgi:hypothetical protein